VGFGFTWKAQVVWKWHPFKVWVKNDLENRWFSKVNLKSEGRNFVNPQNGFCAPKNRIAEPGLTLKFIPDQNLGFSDHQMN